jgi:signal transduction histidine kinase
MRSKRYEQLEESNKQLTEANEQLKVRDKIQNDFINIAAHELRTPIQPILGLSQYLSSKLVEDTEHHQLLDIIVRNAKRLQRLTEDILDVTRIESQALKLNKEKFILNDLVSSIVEEYKNEIGEDNNKNNIKLLYNPIEGNNIIIVEANRHRITQVISNLMDNAIKFTKEGRGIVSINIKKGGGE